MNLVLFNLVLALLMLNTSLAAQSDGVKEIDFFLHIPPPSQGFLNEIKNEGNDNFTRFDGCSFIFSENNKVLWFTDNLMPVSINEDGYLFKIALPLELMENYPNLESTPKFYFTRVKIGYSEKSIDYKGDKKPVEKIKLKISSTPEGATIYYVTLRDWERLGWNKTENENPNLLLEPAKFSNLNTYKITSGRTNTEIYVNEKVCKIVFILNNKVTIENCQPMKSNPSSNIVITTLK